MANKLLKVLGVYILSLLTDRKSKGNREFVKETTTRQNRTTTKVTNGSLTGCTNAIYCTDGSYGEYCYYSCCNNGPNRPCCYTSYYDSYYLTSYYSLSAGAIAGIVIGCIIGIGIFVTVIICICNFKRRNTQYGGQVIRTSQPTLSYITAHSGHQYTQPYTGNVNGGFTMGPTVPAYNTDTNSAPPPSNSNVGNSPTMDVNQSDSYQTQAHSTPVTTNYSNAYPNTDSNEHYYSKINESPS